MRNVRCNERICSNRKSVAVEVVFRFRGEGEGHEVASPPPRLKLDHRRRSRPALDYQPVAFHYGGRRSNIIEDHTENVLVGSRLPHRADQTALSLSLSFSPFFLLFYSFISPVPSFQAFSLSSLLFPAFSGEIYLFRDSLRRLKIRIVGKKWNSMKFFCRDISSIRIAIKWGTKMKIIVINSYV